MVNNYQVLNRRNLATISFVVGVPLGASNEKLNGATKLMFSQILQNSTKIDGYNIFSYMDKYGIRPFASIKKTYSFIGMNTPPKNIEKATKLFELLLLEPSFNNVNIKKFTKKQQAELQQLSQAPHERLQNITRWKAAFGDSNITKTPNGSVDDLQQITVEEIEKNYEEFKDHKPVFSAIGINNNESYYTEIIDRLSEFGSKEFSTELRNDQVNRYNTEIEQNRETGGNSYLGVNCETFGHDANSEADWLYSNLLSGGNATRLLSVLRNKYNLSYSSYSIISRQRDFGLFTTIADVTPEHNTKVLELILNILQSTLTEKIEDDELERAIKLAQKSIVSVTDSSIQYTEYLISRLINNLETDFSVRKKQVEEAAASDWQEMLLKYFTKDNFTLAVTGDPGNIENHWQEILERVL